MARFKVTAPGDPGEVSEFWLGFGPAGPVIAKLPGGVTTDMDLTEEQAASVANKPGFKVEPAARAAKRAGGE